MNKNAFKELIASVKEAGAIARGEKKPARVFAYSAPNVKAIRKKMGLSQSQFAALIGVNVRTLQNWEQGRRTPHGPALALLKVAKSEPESVYKALRAA
jgi:putative transcriptional regulator